MRQGCCNRLASTANKNFVVYQKCRYIQNVFVNSYGAVSVSKMSSLHNDPWFTSDWVGLKGDRVGLIGDRVDLKGDRVGLIGDRVILYFYAV